MNRKKCLVIGYINNNFGDDLFFKILIERYKNVDFYLFPPAKLLKTYKQKFKKNKNVKFYDKEKYYKKIKKEYPLEAIDIFPLICEKAEEVDFYINIGGSIFIQNNNWKNDDRFKIKDILKDKPSFIIGCNFGPSDQEYEEYYKSWFKKFEDICFRDLESYNKFKDLNNVRHADDIVLIMNNKKVKRKRKNVAVSVVNIEKKEKLKEYKNDYYQYLVNAITNLQEENYKVKIFSFCDNEGDLETANLIKDMLPRQYKKKVKIYNYQTSIDKFLNEWNKNEYVIGSRFHSIILALANEQKFLPISYSQKTNNYLKKYNKGIKVINIKGIKNKKAKLKFYKISQQYNSDEQFKKIDEYLNYKRGE